MVIIVDASITLAWCLADESDEFAERVLDLVSSQSAQSPAHWPLEVANGLLAAERSGRISAEEIVDVSRMLTALPIEVMPVELSTATGTIVDTARDQKLSVYDAAYVDLARFRNVPLATLDRQLAAAAEEAGIRLVS